MKDTVNLRNDAHFSTYLYRNASWVPINTLGTTRYTNKEMCSFARNNRRNISNLLKNPYEVIQYIQMCGFLDSEDIKYEMHNDRYWETHCSGLEAILRNEGNCTALAALFYYILANYFSVKTLCFISQLGVGHVVNYIEYNSKLYFYDLYTQIPPYLYSVAPETGRRETLSNSMYITGICIETNSVSDYISLFKRYNILKKRKYTFLHI